ncbi:hypothetical protein SDJN03_26950, partial [Cucurbita argyrosperma subsp. sororia]
MHSLSFKVFGDFNAGSRMNLPGRGSFCVPEMEVGMMRCFGGRRAFGRNCRIVACASERNADGGGSQSQSARAISSERFEDAAKYRDDLNEIAPHSLLKCASDATTLGIRVQVRSVYIEGRSQPSKNQYFFAYRIRITNNSNRPVQLLRRHWIITDANGKTENVRGVGVIGEQPVILPKTGFEYSSACPLTTANGRMEGDYEMKYIDIVGEQSFNVAIAPFSLSILGDSTDAF